MYDLGLQFRHDQANETINEQAVIKGKYFRITVLTERLLRLEFNPRGNFTNKLTEFVQNRNFPLPKFDVKQDDKFLELTTHYFKVEYQKDKNFDGGKVNPAANFKLTCLSNDRVWHYDHPEARNYGGIFTSFDGDKSNQKVEKGLYSIEGFASFNDSNSLVRQSDGTFVARDDKYLDMYIFCYGKDFDLALQDYYKLTGLPNLLPRYALGNWYCKNTNYTTDKIKGMIASFEKNDIPLSVLLLDKDWHKREIKEGKTKRKTESGFTFNKESIPDVEKLLEYIHIKNIKVGVQVNPKEGIYPIDDNYKQAIPYLGIKDGNKIPLDLNNPVFIDVYLKLFLHPLESLGVDFFWNNYLPTENDINNLWLLNHFHYFDAGRIKAKRPLTLARPGKIAPHRYPIIYSGESEASWDVLKRLPKLYQQATNIGVSWISHDIAGNHGGIEDPELYIRSVQLGVFSPILRFHAARSKYYKREPWRWDLKTKNVVEDYLKLRHKLLPYLYTEAYLTYQNGKTLIEPLYRKNQWIYDDSVYSNEYLFGSQMLIAPILEKKNITMNRTIHKFYLPEGIWYDFKTGKKFPGNKKYVNFFKDEDYPVFVQSGAIIPLSLKSNENNTGNPTDLEINIFPGKSNNYVLYEDDGTTSLYSEGYYLKTSIDYNYLENNYTLILRAIEGKSGIIPETRNYKIRFRNTKLAENVTVYFNNDQVEFKKYIEDNDFVIELKNISTIGQLTINCKGQNIEIDAARLINDDLDSILMDLQIETFLKERIAAIMFSNTSIKEKRIGIRKLKQHGLSKEYINLFIKLLEYMNEI